MNHVSIPELRQREAQYAKVCRDLNKIPTYVSPTALYNRPQALSKLAPKVKNFFAVIDGTRVVPAGGGYGTPRLNVHDVVSRVRRVVQTKCAEKIGAPVTSFANQLQSVIGRIVHPVLSAAYPVLSARRNQDDYDDDDDQVCDVDYDGDDNGAYSPAGQAPMYTPAPMMDVSPNHAITAPLPIQTGAYKKREARNDAYLADGGDAYDSAPLR